LRDFSSLGSSLFRCKFVGSYFNCSSCVYDLVAMVHKKSNGGSARVIEGRMGSWTDDFYVCVNNQSLALHYLLKFCFRWGCCRRSGAWGEVWSFLSLFLVRCCLMVVSSDVSIHQYKSQFCYWHFMKERLVLYLSSLSVQILSQFSVQIIAKIVVLFRAFLGYLRRSSISFWKVFSVLSLKRSLERRSSGIVLKVLLPVLVRLLESEPCPLRLRRCMCSPPVPNVQRTGFDT